MPTSMVGRMDESSRSYRVTRGNRTCMVLSRSPLSERVTDVELANMPFGRQHCKLEAHFHHAQRPESDGSGLPTQSCWRAISVNASTASPVPRPSTLNSCAMA